MKIVQLGGRKTPVSGYALVDDEDFLRVDGLKWNLGKRGYAIVYAGRSNGRSIYVKLHHFIFGQPIGEFVIDHINGNTLDNRKENLRICSQAENGRNLKKCKRNTSGYKGVTRAIRRSKVNGVIWVAWLAQISVSRKYHFLGYFKDRESAARAYDEAAKKYHGEFASVNFK